MRAGPYDAAVRCSTALSVPPMSTDAHLLRNAISAIGSVPGLCSSRCYVDVRNCVISIRGWVNSTTEQHEAEQIIRRIVHTPLVIFEIGVTSTPTVHTVSSKDPARAALT
jgi:hypothetical protein